MRAVRPSRSSRRSTAVAAGAAALVALTPAAAVATGDTAEDDAVTEPQAPATDVVLPDEEQQDQVVVADETAAPVADDAALQDPAVEAEGDVAEPGDAPAAEPADAPFEEPASQGPVAPEPGDEADLAQAPIAGAYGFGKIEVSASTPDGDALAGATVEVSTDTGREQTLTTTDADADADAEILLFEQSPGETVTFTITDAPDGFMLTEDVQVVLPPCEGSEVFAGGPVICSPQYVDFDLVAEYRRVAVAVADEDGAPLAGATFELRGVPGPDGVRPVLDTAVSGADGLILFDAVTPGADLALVNTAVPEHYLVLTEEIPLALPAVATQAEADVPVVVAVGLELDLLPPVTAPLAVSTVSDGRTTFVDVLAVVDGDGAEVTIDSASASAGTVTIGTEPGCTTDCVTGLLYTAPRGFAGTVTLTYEVSTLAGTATGTVDVTVTAPPVTGGPGTRAPALADTGAEPAALVALAAGLVLAGSVAQLARRRARGVRA